jgi:two-component system, chemotaxis family, chemotaxis protein CheY
LAGILLVDDYEVARTTVREMLRWHDLKVCGEAKDGKEAIQKVKELNPDVVLLDVNMPVMNGMEAAREIRRISPRTKILFLTVIGSQVCRPPAGRWLRYEIRRGNRIDTGAGESSSHLAQTEKLTRSRFTV